MSAKDQIKRIVDSFKREPQLKDKTDGMTEGLLLGAQLADDANELSKETDASFKALQREYTENGNGSQTTAEITVARDGELVLDDRLKRDFENVNAQLAQSIKYVNYEMFKKDGMNDGEIIKNTHDYANEHNLPVVNIQGEFWLDEPLNVEIKTLTNWGSTKFHINESKYKQWIPYFRVKNTQEDIYLTNDKIQLIVEALNTSSDVIPILNEYENSYMIVTDTNTKVGARSGYGTTWDKVDMFYISNNGKLIGDKMWDTYTANQIKIRPSDMNYLNVTGGEFILNGETPVNVLSTIAMSPVIYVERSFTRMVNQIVRLENNATDNVINPVNGFYGVYEAYDVELVRSRLLPRKNNSISGSYGIHGAFMLKIKLTSIVGVTDDGGWGLTGTNYIKDLIVDDCVINRVDVHYKAWNVTIKNSYVEDVTLTGGGKLLVTKSKIRNTHSMILFRSDYGSTWNGEIIIDDIDYYLEDNSTVASLLNFHGSSESFDYIDKLVLGNSILVDNIRVHLLKKNDLESTDYNSVRDIYVIRPGEWSKGIHQTIHFPSRISVNNVSMTGRENVGFKLMHLYRLEYALTKAGGNISGELVTNCDMSFKNIQTKDFEVTNDDGNYSSHLAVGQIATGGQAANQLIPNILIENVPFITVKVHGSFANVMIKNSKIRHYSGRGQISETRSIFKAYDCTIEGKVAAGKQVVHYSDTEENAYFYGASALVNCMYMIPIVDGVVDVVNLSTIGVVDPVNDIVKSTHINSRFTKPADNTVSASFKNKMFSFKA